jgi:DNA invertase Pin-like site-specific DNA recombinase
LRFGDANTAIYARKSTDQAIVDQEKSVTRQIELAIACASAHGFEVPPEHIYIDDASRGLSSTDGRVSFGSSMPSTSGPILRLFIADKDRLGREQFETNHVLKQISVAGVRIFEYQNGGQEVRLDSPIDKLIMSVSNFAAELERAKASQRTRDACRSKRSAGTSSAASSSATATSQSSVMEVGARMSCARSVMMRRRRSDGFSAWRAVTAFARSPKP